MGICVKSAFTRLASGVAYLTLNGLVLDQFRLLVYICQFINELKIFLFLPGSG